MIILEEHNRQLETQLGKLKQILEVMTIFICCKTPRLNLQFPLADCDQWSTMQQSLKSNIFLKFCQNKIIIFS